MYQSFYLSDVIIVLPNDEKALAWH